MNCSNHFFEGREVDMAEKHQVMRFSPSFLLKHHRKQIAKIFLTYQKIYLTVGNQIISVSFKLTEVDDRLAGDHLARKIEFLTFSRNSLPKCHRRKELAKNLLTHHWAYPTSDG